MNADEATQLRTVYTFKKLDSNGIARVEQEAKRLGLRSASDLDLGFVKVMATGSEMDVLEEALNV